MENNIVKLTLKRSTLLSVDELGNVLDPPVKYDYDIDIALHKARSNKIVVIYPGAGGTLDGYENKYLKLAGIIQDRIGCVVRQNNVRVPTANYHSILCNNLETVLEYVLNNSLNIFDIADPEVYLMGFSNGAGATAAVAYKYPQVSKLLLLAPAFGAGTESVAHGLGLFTGEVYIAIGKNDINVGYKTGQVFKELSKSASLVKLEVIPMCDHQFRGEVNSMILSKAPLWAFNNDSTFPSPDDGIKLYD